MCCPELGLTPKSVLRKYNKFIFVLLRVSEVISKRILKLSLHTIIIFRDRVSQVACERNACKISHIFSFLGGSTGDFS